MRTAALRPDRVVERAEKLGNSSTVDSRVSTYLVVSSTIVLQIPYLRTYAIPMIPGSFVKLFPSIEPPFGKSAKSMISFGGHLFGPSQAGTEAKGPILKIGSDQYVAHHGHSDSPGVIGCPAAMVSKPRAALPSGFVGL